MKVKELFDLMGEFSAMAHFDSDPEITIRAVRAVEVETQMRAVIDRYNMMATLLEQVAPQVFDDVNRCASLRLER